MQVFSQALSGLYQAAETVVPQAFQQEAFRLFRQLVFFDGGINGVISVKKQARYEPKLVHANLYGRGNELLKDYQSVLAEDPVIRRMFNGISAPYSCSCLQWYRERHLLHLYAFAKKHEIGEVLIFGEPASDRQAQRWIGLFRRSSHPFDAEDAMMMHVWWPHLVRATRSNLRHALSHQGETRRDNGRALLDKLGHVEIFDPGFTEMLREEWPKEQGPYLPKAAWESLQQRGQFKGRSILLTARALSDYIVCEAQRLSELDRLGALERTVALLLAAGHDYKTIASKMGTSPNTVRNQISRIYKKLNVHDKLSLALLFRRLKEQPSHIAPTISSDPIEMHAVIHAQSADIAFENISA